MRLEAGRAGPGDQLGVLLGVDLGGLYRDARQADGGVQVGAQRLDGGTAAQLQREAGAVGLAEQRIDVRGAAAAGRIAVSSLPSCERAPFFRP
jgi:hypothetical protein